MERLTAFEFIAAADGPQLVRLKRSDVVLAQLAFIGWVGVADIETLSPGLELVFERRQDLVIEGQGIGRPYWNGEQPTWAVMFDAVGEARRIEAVRAAVQREINRAALSLE